MLQVTSSDFDAGEGTLKKVLRGGLLIILQFGRKNKKEIIIKLVQQSKALKSIGLKARTMRNILPKKHLNSNKKDKYIPHLCFWFCIMKGFRSFRKGLEVPYFRA